LPTQGSVNMVCTAAAPQMYSQAATMTAIRVDSLSTQ
jgi:hypothetical protein